jgi:hypothetical protein
MSAQDIDVEVEGMRVVGGVESVFMGEGTHPNFAL